MESNLYWLLKIVNNNYKFILPCSIVFRYDYFFTRHFGNNSKRFVFILAMYTVKKVVPMLLIKYCLLLLMFVLLKKL